MPTMTLGRLFGTWAALALAMTANGIAREALLRPWLRERADVVSAVLGAAIILGVTRLPFRPFRLHSREALVQSSLLLVGLTVAFEVAIGRWVDHRTWTELLANYALWRGELWPLLLILVGATPFIWGSRGREGRHAH